MIERWLQLTCDNEDCGEVANSTAPNMTVAELLADEPGFVKVGNKHYCKRCVPQTRRSRKGQER